MKFEIYQGEDKQYHWRLKARNGRIIAVGGEGYTKRSSAKRAVYMLITYNFRVTEILNA